jgi:quercetin dioxygenase-like cupin family protein
MKGTLDSHLKLAKGLDVDLSQLYLDTSLIQDTKAPAESSRKAEIFEESRHSSYQILAHDLLSKKMMPVLLKIESHGHTPLERNKPGNEKFIYIVDGKIEAAVGNSAHSLSAGQTLYFDASLPHSFKNTGPKQVRMLVVMTPVEL